MNANDPDLKFRQQLIRRLDILISLALETREDQSITTKIRHLAELGLTPSEIGNVLGKKANYVSAVLGGKARKA